jgi:hypothetical protein
MQFDFLMTASIDDPKRLEAEIESVSFYIHGVLHRSWGLGWRSG